MATKTAASKTTKKAAPATKAAGTRARKPKVEAEPQADALTPAEKRRARRAARIAAEAKGEAIPKTGRAAKAKGEASAKSKRERGAGRIKLAERYEEEGAKVQEAMTKLDGDIDKVAENLGMSKMKVRKLSARASIDPKNRITGTDEEIGAEIARLRDEEGLGWMPELWSRTGMTPKRMKALYEQSTGKSWKESGKPSKRAQRKAASESGERAPRGKGRRAQRAANVKLLEELHADGTTKERIAEILQGKTLSITFTVGDKERTDEAFAKKVRKVGAAKSGGSAVDFMDADGKSRVVKLTDITAIVS